jgi:site-specific DNA-cytosine methylase
LSFAGKGKGLIEGARSSLFFAFVDLLKAIKPKYFLVENVRMKKEYQDMISDILGVQPIKINSSLVSAQNRVRLYWTNIPNIEQPRDRGIVLSDILEEEVDSKYDAGKHLLEGYRGGDQLNPNYKSQANTIHRDKVATLSAGTHGYANGYVKGRHTYRKLTPIECERLQTVPDNYTAHVSNTQRYKMLGNGFTVEVIKHILSNMEK